MRKLHKAMINWREVPFVRLLFPLVLGILAGFYFGRSFPWLNYLLFFLFSALIITNLFKLPFRLRWISGVLVNVFLFCFAYQLTFYQSDWNKKDHFRNYLTKDNWIVGLVENKPTFKSRVIQVQLVLRQIGSSPDHLQKCSGSILLNIRNDTINQNIKYGDLILINTRPRRLTTNPNPATFDYAQYLARRNIHYQAYAKGEDWTKLAKGQANPVLALAFRCQDRLINILEKHLPGENELAVATALILGNKEKLNPELRSAYSETGAMHVLAVSGLHVGLIWGIISFVFSFIHWRHPTWSLIKTLLTLAGLWAFALVTGASPSVLRAATMFSFLIIGTALQRHSNIYNTLAVSAFCLLLFNPFLILEVGFQLSYLAVLGIVYFYRKIYGSWYIENYLGDQIWKLVAVAIAAQLSTLPLTIFYFHQFPLYFLLSGLVVVPFASLILSTGIILFLVESIIPFLSVVIAKLLYGVLWLMNALIYLIQQLPSGYFKAIWVGEWSMLLLFLVLACIVFAINTKNFRWVLGAMTFLLGLASINAWLAITHMDQRILVFYNIPKQHYIECIDGNLAFAYGDRVINASTLDYNTKSFHIRQDVDSLSRYHLPYDEVSKNNWMLRSPFIQFYDKRIAILKDLPAESPKQKIKLDAILFRKDATATLEQAMDFFEFNQVVVDGALDFYQWKDLLQECERLKIPCHDTREKALIIKIK